MMSADLIFNSTLSDVVKHQEYFVTRGEWREIVLLVSRADLNGIRDEICGRNGL